MTECGKRYSEQRRHRRQ